MAKIWLGKHSSVRRRISRPKGDNVLNRSDRSSCVQWAELEAQKQRCKMQDARSRSRSPQIIIFGFSPANTVLQQCSTASFMMLQRYNGSPK